MKTTRMKTDIIFVSYGERNADVNWNLLVKRFEYAKRVKDVKGINNAYKLAANVAQTDFFYIVDADNIILPEFNFDFNPTENSIGTYIWKAYNAVNNLTYGYGGVKLYNREDFNAGKRLSYEGSSSYEFMNSYDFPVVPKIKFLKDVASITEFNSSPFDAWKAAFRECCKLITFSHYLKLDQQQVKEDLSNLNIWCSLGIEKKFGDWVIKGANDGKQFGIDNKNNINEISKINDYVWLREYFTKKHNYVFTE